MREREREREVASGYSYGSFIAIFPFSLQVDRKRIGTFLVLEKISLLSFHGIDYTFNQILTLNSYIQNKRGFFHSMFVFGFIVLRCILKVKTI